MDKRFIAWPDTHLPSHDPLAVRTALKILDWYRPSTVVVLGDFLDCAPVSHWLSQNSRNRTKENLRLSSDYRVGNELLDKVTKGVKELTYIEGNHEDWINDAIEKNPEFEGLIELELGLKFNERRRKLKLNHIKYGECWNMGKLWFTHGTYTSANHAMRHVQAYGRSIVYGHMHDVQMAVKVSPIDVNDKHLGLSLGCLAHKNPKFMENRPNNWVHAVGVGVIRSDGTFNIDPIIISEGVASYGGRTFRG